MTVYVLTISVEHDGTTLDGVFAYLDGAKARAELRAKRLLTWEETHFVGETIARDPQWPDRRYWIHRMEVQE